MDCPAFLDDEGRREWFRLAPHVFAIVGASQKTAERLGRYNALFLEWRRLGLYLREHGCWRTTRKGWRFRPEYIREQKVQRMMHYLSAQLGMSPLARARIRARQARRNTPRPGA